MVEPAVCVMVLPEFSASLLAEAGLIAPTMVMAPLLASPITIVLAVMLSSSASLTPRLMGKSPPSAIALPAVAWRMVATPPVPALIVPSMSALSATRLTSAPVAAPLVVSTATPAPMLMRAPPPLAPSVTAPPAVTMPEPTTPRSLVVVVMPTLPLPAVPLTFTASASTMLTAPVPFALNTMLSTLVWMAPDAPIDPLVPPAVRVSAPAEIVPAVREMLPPLAVSVAVLPVPSEMSLLSEMLPPASKDRFSTSPPSTESKILLLMTMSFAASNVSELVPLPL